jgi:hypothetical protein
MTRGDSSRVRDDGMVVHAEGGGRAAVGLLALAVVLVGVALIVLLYPRVRPAADSAATPRRDDVSARGGRGTEGRVAAAPPSRPLSARDSGAAKPPSSTPGSDAQQPQPAAAAAKAEAGDADAAEPSGIALFPPPGTKPIKRGIVVPEGFDLPPGYVRHYQATDDGELLPPILMFHPDYEFVDEHGAHLQIPEDRVVPPELAPPGMPIEMLQLPEDEATPGAPR